MDEGTEGKGMGQVIHIVMERTWEGEVSNVWLLVAIGVNSEGYREILGICEGAKEDKSGWSGFLRHLVDRGLKGVEEVGRNFDEDERETPRHRQDQPRDEPAGGGLPRLGHVSLCRTVTPRRRGLLRKRGTLP